MYSTQTCIDTQPTHIGTSIVTNGDGSYTLKPPHYYATKKAHAAGTIVSSTNSGDGTHPGSGSQQAAAAPIIAIKPQIPFLRPVPPVAPLTVQP